MPVSDYNDIFKKKGLNFSDIMMTLSVASSDTGYSGVHIYPKVVGIMSDGQRLSIPILGEIRMDHRGSASIEEHRSNLSLAFAQTERSKKRIKELDSISLNYPFNTFCNLLKSVGIGKKQASSIIDQFAVGLSIYEVRICMRRTAFYLIFNERGFCRKFWNKVRTNGFSP